MKHIFAASVLALSFAIAAPALAKSSQKFETSLSAPLNSAVKVEVVIGEDLAYRANNLPKNRRDRGSSSRLRSGFSQNGYYGERDLNRLADRLQNKMAARLSKQGVEITDNADTILRLVITDVKPNRPTFTQLSKDVSLSYQSFGTGGATLEGQLVSAGGQSLGELSYAWYESDIRDASYASTWSDARRAIDRFARKTAKSLKAN